MFVKKSKLLLSIDVEDWFHSENFAKCISRNSWSTQQLRVEQNVNKILEILNDFGVKATFFCLGWIAERVPQLISQIADAGHEIASHGFSHHLIYNQTPEQFRDDVSKAKSLLEDITGGEVVGYRAPTFSITDWSFPILQEVGYEYDSSVVITDIHDRYGLVNAAVGKQAGDFFEIYQGLYEFSLPCLKILGKSIPWGGGGYFRLFPVNLYLSGLEKIISQKDFVFYCHPWEVDATLPHVEGMSFSSRFRQYVNLNKTEEKLRVLLEKSGSNCTTFKSYLQQ